MKMGSGLQLNLSCTYSASFGPFFFPILPFPGTELLPGLPQEQYCNLAPSEQNLSLASHKKAGGILSGFQKA
jgi:hypothetical protein